ncbi:MAG: CsbD family protein [Acidobacteriota bacterium]
MKESTKDKVQGQYEETKGKVKEQTGKALGDRELEKRGRQEKIGGQIREKVGEVKKVFNK